jgi:hypothetical protein
VDFYRIEAPSISLFPWLGTLSEENPNFPKIGYNFIMNGINKVYSGTNFSTIGNKAEFGNQLNTYSSLLTPSYNIRPRRTLKPVVIILKNCQFDFKSSNFQIGFFLNS